MVSPVLSFDSLTRIKLAFGVSQFENRFCLLIATPSRAKDHSDCDPGTNGMQSRP
jgi:hypothetical protein